MGRHELVHGGLSVKEAGGSAPLPRPGGQGRVTGAARFQTRRPEAAPPPAHRAGRLPALSLLLLAMLIWLFTALLFARHGIYHSQMGPYGPPGPLSHFVHGGFQPPGGPANAGP